MANLQRFGATVHWHNGCAEHLHPEYIEALSFHILDAHVDHALKAKLRTNG